MVEETLIGLQEISGVRSVYAYELPAGVIPLLVVTQKLDRDALRAHSAWGEGAILLTQADITYGVDVFALRFLHMKEHAHLLAGRDFLAGVKVKKSHARQALEAMLRMTLIDVREYLLQKKPGQAVQATLALSLDRISAYASMLADIKTKRLEELAIYTHMCEDTCLTQDALLELYHALEKITKKVDKI